MARGIDLSSLTRPERLVLASGAGQLLNGMIPWWYRVVTVDGRVSYNAGLRDWGVVAVLSGAAAAVLVLIRAAIWPEPAPRQDGLIYGALGLLGTVAITVQATRAEEAWIGLFIGLFLALVLAGAGVWRRSERRAGWT